MSNIKLQTKLLQIYLDAGVDEIICEKPINRLIKKDQIKESSSKEKSVKENLIKENLVIKNIEQNLKKEFLNEEEIIIQSHEKIDSRAGFVKELKDQSSEISMFNIANKITTFDAISKLANKQMNNKIDQPLVSISEIINQAKKMAEAAENLAELEKAVRDFDGCLLKKMATNTVFADGNADSEIMIIGEAPGNHEDLQGIPFCGDSGKLLNEMFKAIGFKRENLYITNTLFWRPPGNRRPTDDELAMCKPFVEKHIALMQPKLIVLMGATAMADVLKINEPIGKMRGKFFDYKNNYLSKSIATTVLFHPSYLMRQSSKKREAWMDLLMIKEFILGGK